jgi:4-hydroxy-tetrahydrodipicolinate reductase
MNDKIKYGIIGATGRLGSEVQNVFKENNYELVFSYDIDGETRKAKPGLLIDCSLPEVFPKTTNYVNEFNVPLIVATTGLSDENIKELKRLSQKIPIVQSYNYSTGIQILLKLVQLANEKTKDWDIEISETHHRFKKDKPSGTAKMIKSIFKDRDVNTSSFRLGNVFGEHNVSFASLGEVLSIKHSATSRRTFAEGILKSAEFIMGQSPGLYSFTEVVFNE